MYHSQLFRILKLSSCLFSSQNNDLKSILLPLTFIIPFCLPSLFFFIVYVPCNYCTQTLCTVHNYIEEARHWLATHHPPSVAQVFLDLLQEGRMLLFHVHQLAAAIQGEERQRRGWH